MPTSYEVVGITYDDICWVIDTVSKGSELQGRFGRTPSLYKGSRGNSSHSPHSSVYSSDSIYLIAQGLSSQPSASPGSTQLHMVVSSFWEQEGMLQVRMGEHCVGEAFFMPARLHQSQKQIEKPVLTVGLPSILAFFLRPHNPQAYAWFLWGSVCKSHLTFCSQVQTFAKK